MASLLTYFPLTISPCISLSNFIFWPRQTTTFYYFPWTVMSPPPLINMQHLMLHANTDIETDTTHAILELTIETRGNSTVVFFIFLSSLIFYCCRVWIYFQYERRLHNIPPCFKLKYSHLNSRVNAIVKYI